MSFTLNIGGVGSSIYSINNSSGMRTSSSHDGNSSHGGSSTGGGVGGGPLIKIRKTRRDKRRHQHHPGNNTVPTISSPSSSSSYNNKKANKNKHHYNKSGAIKRGSNNQIPKSSSSSLPSTTESLLLPKSKHDEYDSGDEIMDIGDPLTILALAVQLDESWGDESILQVPLETGRILSSHNSSRGGRHDRKNFVRALIYLQKKTAPHTLPSVPYNIRPPTTTSSSSTDFDGATNDNDSNSKGQSSSGHITISSDNTPVKPFAITPIILSGFLSMAASAEEQATFVEAKEKASEEPNATTSTEVSSTEANDNITALPTAFDVHDPRGDVVTNSGKSTFDNQNSAATGQPRTQKHQQQHPPPASSSSTFPNSTELVTACNSMRRAAIVRVKYLNRRKRISKLLSPVVLIIGMICLYWWTMSSIQFVVLDLGYIESCRPPVRGSVVASTTSTTTARTNTNLPSYHYQDACRLAGANLWEKLYPSYFTHRYYQEYYEMKEEPTPNSETKTAGGMTPPNSSCNLDECSTSVVVVEGQDPRPFYAMHTQLAQTIIPLDQVVGRRGRRDLHRSSSYSTTSSKRYNAATTAAELRRIMLHKNSGGSSGSSSSSSSPNTGYSTPLQWLGDTIVNGLVREALDEYLTSLVSTSTQSSSASSTTVSLLDVGCGIGGTLYSLVPPPSPSFASLTSTSVFGKDTTQLVYRGISINGPEINQARRLSRLHGLANNNNNDKASSSFPAKTVHEVQFFEQSFDDPLPPIAGSGASSSNSYYYSGNRGDQNKYMSMVAIESLSYSHNISATLSNLASSLKRGGILIMVDDVVAPWASQRSTGANDNVRDRSNGGATNKAATSLDPLKELKQVSARHSLLTHDEWTSHFESNGFVIQHTRDLGLEFDLPHAQPSFSTSFGSTSTSSSSRWFQTISEIRRRPALYVLQKVQHWLANNSSGEGNLSSKVEDGKGMSGDGITTQKQANSTTSNDDKASVSLNIVQLLQDLIYTSQASSLRNAAHSRADLSYYIYVCIKE